MNHLKMAKKKISIPKLEEFKKGNVRCPKYMESICDILDYLVWLKVNGYEGGYGEDSMDEDDNGIPIMWQTNAMYDCVMDVHYPFDEQRFYENYGVDIIEALEEWVNSLFIE